MVKSQTRRNGSDALLGPLGSQFIGFRLQETRIKPCLISFMLGVLLFAYCHGISFDDHQVWETKATGHAQLQVLQQLWFDQKIDLWSSALNRPILFSASQSSLEQAKSTLTDAGLSLELIMPNLQQALDSHATQIGSQAVLSGNQFFSKYQKISELHDFIRQLAADNPNLASTFSIGSTFENRDILGIKIGSPNATKSIVLHGGIHAREWIGPAVVTFIANELVGQYGKSDKVTNILNEFNFHIIPVLNVDGYVFTHQHNRMWRKNRQPTNPSCTGVDLNRNFAYGWSGPGASGEPCSDAYYGEYAFSATESVNLAYFLGHTRPLGYIGIFA